MSVKMGRLSRDQLGIWSDAHVPGLKRIVEAVHGEGVPLLLQIHHAGVVSETEDPVCPSDYSLVFKEGSAMGGSFLWRRSRRSKGIS